MRTIIILLVLAIPVLTSCAGTDTGAERKAGLQKLWYGTTCMCYIQDSVITVKHIDTMYHIGDRVQLNNHEYIVVR